MGLLYLFALTPAALIGAMKPTTGGQMLFCELALFGWLATWRLSGLLFEKERAGRGRLCQIAFPFLLLFQIFTGSQGFVVGAAGQTLYLLTAWFLSGRRLSLLALAVLPFNVMGVACGLAPLDPSVRRIIVGQTVGTCLTVMIAVGLLSRFVSGPSPIENSDEIDRA